MELFDRLGAEHLRIHSVASALDVFVDDIVGDSIDLHEVIRFVTFFRGFADGLHHAREESVLLPCLALTAFAPDSGPLAYIRDQHGKEATLLFELEKAASANAPWGPKEYSEIARAAHAFTVFLRLHMAEERKLLFPDAEKELAAYPDAVREASERFDRHSARRWDTRWLEDLGTALVASHPK